MTGGRTLPVHQDVFSKSKWIWIDHHEDVNQHVEFRRAFGVSELPATELLSHISVDSDYELWTLKWHRNFDTTGPWTKAGGVQPADWPEWMRRFKDY